MATVEVFDPPMCCSTGVWGPSVDPALAAFAADLGWFADQGVVVERYNLSQEPKAFADSGLVRELLTERGDEVLPAVVVDGALHSSGRYPSRGAAGLDRPGVQPGRDARGRPWTHAGAGRGGLDAPNVDPLATAAAYRERVVGPCRCRL